MEPFILAKVYENRSLSKKEKDQLLEKVEVNYCIPDSFPGKNEMRAYAGYTSLHFAVRMRSPDNLVIGLLNRGADLVTQGKNDGYTPLHVAMKAEHLYEASGLLQKCDSIDILLSKQVEMKNNSNPKCKKHGTSHFHIACIVNHVEAVEFFVKAKVDLHQKINSDSKYLAGYTPLHCSIEYSAIEAAKVLLENGVDINVKNTKGLSCIHLLLQRLLDTTDIIKLGKRKLCTNYEQEIERLESMIKLILETRGRNEIFTDEAGFSALHMACTLRDKTVVEGFLQKVVHVNVPTKSEFELWPGWTPLHFAACFSIKIMMLLMQNEANILMKNLKGETPLDLCAKRFSTSDVQLTLSQEGALKSIVLSDYRTKLTDLFIIMNNFKNFEGFLQKLKNVSVVIPVDSTVWPGYTLLHLCICLNEKTKDWIPSIDLKGIYNNVYRLTDTIPKHYNCTKDEEALHGKRIDLCLESGYSADVENANGQTPIHLAFTLLKEELVKKLLKFSKENVGDENGLSHLHIACAVGHLDAVKKYLSGGANANDRVRLSFNWYNKGNEEWEPYDILKNVNVNSTPLHVAVIFSHKNIVKCLLKHQADVYALDSRGFTPMHILTYSHTLLHGSIGKLLFNATPDLQNLVSPTGLSHLHVAAWVNNGRAVNQLLINGANVEQAVNTDVEKISFLARLAGQTPLYVAITRDADKAIKALLKAGANIYAKDLKGVSALQLAMQDVGRRSCSQFIKLTKKGKCDFEACGMTPLHLACGNHDIEWAKELVKNGADVNARMSAEKGDLKGATPLYVLLEKLPMNFNHQKVVSFIKFLLDKGADVIIDSNGSTPLHLIYKRYYRRALFDDEDDDYDEDDINNRNFFQRTTDLLLQNQKSYDVNPVDNVGFSHFHFACVRNDVDTATKFLDQGFDVNAQTDPFEGWNRAFTPLHFAMAYRSKEVAYFLLERGADINAEDVKGNKPLHVAIQNKFVDFPLIEHMLRCGADINAKNMNGETLLYCLLRSDCLTFERFEFFLRHGCSMNILNATNEDHQGVIGLAMRTAPPNELQSILEKLMHISEIKSAVKNGFNIIESIVAVGGYLNERDEPIAGNQLTIDNYLSAIEMSIDIGCDLDSRDTKGNTALDTALFFYNDDAINALLQLGADVNLINNKHKCPLADEMTNDEDDDLADPEFGVVKAIAGHFWKMRLIKLKLKESNLTYLRRAEKEFRFLRSLEQSCQDELLKAEDTEICVGLTVRDFLSELGAVAEYPRMCSIRRAIVDKFFKCAVDLRRKFPEFSGILALQHKKATARMELCEPAKNVIALVCPIGMPDLCLEAVMRYFRNDEMKLLIEIGEDLDHLFNSSK